MIELPKLPFASDALEPVMSKTTLEIHHGKHHKAYVDKTNELTADSDLAGKSLEEIVRAAADRKGAAALFNHAAQAWNHSFFWQCLTPGGKPPTGALAEKIQKDLGGLATLAETFKKAAVGQFGSGWAWLCLAEGKLEVSATANADTPLVHAKTPLLVLDVWEHAYYLDYQNRRPDFVTAFLEKLANWDFAASNLQRAGMRKAAE
jgi:Fe-Mn family superoxide dismutase